MPLQKTYDDNEEFKSAVEALGDDNESNEDVIYIEQVLNIFSLSSHRQADKIESDKVLFEDLFPTA